MKMSDITGAMSSLGAKPQDIIKGTMTATKYAKNPLKPTQQELTDLIKNSDFSGLEKSLPKMLNNPKASQLMASMGVSESQIIGALTSFGLIGGNGNSKTNNSKPSFPRPSSQNPSNKYDKYR